MVRDYHQNPIRVFLTYYKPHRKLLAIDMACVLVSSFANLLVPIASRNAIGITEFFGMLASVAFGILLVPGLYALFQTWRENIKRVFSYISTMAYRKRQLKAREVE